MKTTFILIICFLFISPNILSQEEFEKEGGAYYKFSFATTLGLNEDFESKIEGETYGDRVYAGKTFLRLSAFFFETSVGYQFGKRAALGINLGYHYHSEQGLHFLPAYVNARINLSDNDDSFFIRSGYGQIFRINSDFESGNIYKIGLGFQSSNNILGGFEFTHKNFGYRKLTGLSSLSVFIEYALF